MPITAISVAWDIVDGVSVDTMNGVSLSTSPAKPGESSIGLPSNPVNSHADFMRIALAKKLYKLYLTNPQCSLTLTEWFQGYHVIGSLADRNVAQSIVVNGQHVECSQFENVAVFSSASGKMLAEEGASFINCQMDVYFGGTIHCFNSRLFDISIMNGELFATDCSGEEKMGTAIWTSDADSIINLINFKGYVQLQHLVGGIHRITGNNAIIQLADNCIGGTLVVEGTTRIIPGLSTTKIIDNTINKKLDSILAKP